MFRSLLLVAFLLVLSSSAFAQNPCTVPPALVINPTTLYMEAPDFNVTEVDGSFRYSQFQFAMFAEGADPNSATPVQGPSTLPRSAFTAVSGAPNCYRVSLPGTIPTAQRLFGSIKSQRTSSGSLPAAESPWSSLALGNPFGSAPTVLATVGAVRVGS